MEELGRQAIEIISKIAKSNCGGITCNDCILGYNHTDICNGLSRIYNSVEEYED